MDDLAGLSWSSQPSTSQKQPNYSSAFANLKPTPPTSGRASPLPPARSPAPLSKPATPANDSFSNLVSFSSSNTSRNVSLQEQQKRLADLKSQQLVGNKKPGQDHWAGVDEKVWENLGSGTGTPAIQSSGQPKIQSIQPVEEDDIFAAFNASTVKPVPTSNVRKPKPVQEPEVDDDPFGLSEFQARSNTNTRTVQSYSADDDDILGDLGRPVAERRPAPRQDPAPEPVVTVDHPQDKAIAELVDMGFSVEKARQALETTESGVDVQKAVGWLLNQAHAEAKQKTGGRESGRSRNGGDNNGQPSEPPRHRPARGQDDLDPRRTRERSSTPSGEPVKMASELGSTFIKTAGSFWKQAQKQVQHTIQEFNSDSDSNQPKWMRDAQSSRSTSGALQSRDETGPRRQRRRSSGTKSQPNVTDEALMLEGERPTPPPRQAPRARPERVVETSADSSRDHSPAFPSRLRESRSPQPAFLRSQRPTPVPSAMPTQPQTSKPTLNRQAAEEQAAQAYVSSARRRKPATPATSTPEPDLLESTSRQTAPSNVSRPIATRPSQPATPAVQVTPIQVRPSAPKRSIPPVSSISLKASHAARTDGNNHFKRGDYSAAHSSYTSSLLHLPGSHPIVIVLLTNRALTALKIGEPKTSIADADTAITLIGPSKGESEVVDFGDGEQAKPMREYYGKALMRKAEALEHLEKWTEAAAVWKLAVEDGHGGSTAIQGRIRAEKAAQPKPTKPLVKKPPAKPPSRPTITHAKSSQAVTALRAANAAAEKADDEKFALADSVDARLNAWRGGKADNLRALLGSLEAILWPEAGWKKISMADLILPGKVKVQYMKGIAKVHPDKIPTTATTEQRMIAGAVFSTLNEAWDKFKTENGL